MWILVIETSARRGEVALADAERIVATRVLLADRQHARDLAPAIRSLLDEAGLVSGELELVLVDCGPGSYTGLRVGITAAKTLAYVTGAALVSVDAMTVLAEDLTQSTGPIATIVDAQQGLLYGATFECRVAGEPPVPIEPTTIASAADWLARLPAGCTVSGPALQRFRPLVPAHCALAPEPCWTGSAHALWSAGRRRFAQGHRDDLWQLEPLYLRPSAAEEKWRTRQPSTSDLPPQAREATSPH